MPAEWEPHEATWLGWPHELTDWPGKFAPIPWAFAEIVRHLTRVERVNLLVEDRAAESRVKAILRKSGAALEAVTFFHVPTDRGWMRDSGPIATVESPARVVIPRSEATRNLSSGAAREIPRSARDDSVKKQTVLLNFAFNGWAKYDDYKKDAKVVSRLATQMDGQRRAKELRRARHAVSIREKAKEA
jgi:agmatine deiminase